jgi:hypothetical protein
MITEDVAAEKLAITARESISSYCYTECKAYCCRRGYLLLKAEELQLIKGMTKKNPRMIPVYTKLDKHAFALNLGGKLNGCPNLTDYKCTIHKNPLRPKTCKDFPLFIRANKTIMITNACPAVFENKFYPFLAEFKKMGYKLEYAENKF